MNKVIAVTVVFFLIGGAFVAGRFSVKPMYAEIPLAETASGRVRVGSEADLLMLRSENAALRAEVTALRAAAESASVPQPTVLIGGAGRAAVPAEQEFPADDTAKEEAERRLRRGPSPEAMARMRQHMADTQQSRVTFLDSVDLSLMTAEQQEIHAAYTEALSRRAAAMETLMMRAEAGEEPTEEERRAVWEVSRELRRLQNDERNALFEAVGISMGLGQDEASVLADVIREINDSTSDTFRHPPRPPAGEEQSPAQGDRP